MEHPQAGSSLPRIFDQLEAILAMEYQSSNTPWIPIARLKEMACQRHGIRLDLVAQNYGFDSNLKGLLKSSRRFAIYGTPVPQEFYVARLKDTVPNHSPGLGKSVQYRIKRPWKVDRGLINMLETEGAKRISPKPYSGRLSDRLTLPPKLSSIDDLEIALTAILKDLTINSPQGTTTIAALSQKFYNHYRQPIRTVLRSLCPGRTLTDLLEMMPHCQVWEKGTGEILLRYGG